MGATTWYPPSTHPREAYQGTLFTKHSNISVRAQRESLLLIQVTDRELAWTYGGARLISTEFN